MLHETIKRGGKSMKRLLKRSVSIRNTVQSYSDCKCQCRCSCWCETQTGLANAESGERGRSLTAEMNWAIA